MTQPEHQPTPDEMRELFQQMQISILDNAMHYVDRVGLRTMVALEDLGLYENQAVDRFGSDMDLDVLLEPAHPRRLPLPSGPLLLYKESDEKAQRRIVEVPTLLYSDLPAVRKAALIHLELMINDGTLAVTPKTREVFDNVRSKLASDTPHEWRSAAIAAVDAFDDDILVALQGVNQSLQYNPVLQDSLNNYGSRVLYPTVSSLESIVFDVANPDAQHSRMAEVVEAAAAEAASLADACARYYARLGHLPLAPIYSLGEVVTLWMTANPSCDAWAEVWSWAHGSRRPIPRYHACSVFIMHPELIPDGKLPDLWREILEVADDSDKEDAENVEREHWTLRRDLVRHFAYHLEACLPDNDGTNIACISWWLAEKVAALLPDKPESAQFYRKNWVAPALDRSGLIWLDTSPHIGSSFLRYVTMTISSPWAMALLALMGANLEQLAPQEQSPEIQASFHAALLKVLIESLPLAYEQPVEPTYAQESPLEVTALKWAFYQPEDQQKALEQLAATNRSLNSSEGLCEALRKLDEQALADQYVVAFILKIKAFTDPKVASGVWDVVQNTAWRQKVLGSVDEYLLGLLVEAFSLFMIDNRAKWAPLLPHYLAELCEKTENEDHRRQLFLYVVHVSLASDTMSAVRRLLKGDQKTKFLPHVEECRERVKSLWPFYPPWVQGRLRGLLSSLNAH